MHILHQLALRLQTSLFFGDFSGRLAKQYRVVRKKIIESFNYYLLIL